MGSTETPRTCAAILVAAGTSQRMGFDKLAAPLAGIPVLQRTLNAFLNAESISEIIVACPNDRWALFSQNSFSKPVTRVDGGAQRQDSVAAALARIISPFVAIHDAARPLISPDEINRCVAAAFTHHAATLARRVTETIKRSDPSNFNLAPVSREHLWFMETPQVFETKLLLEAYAVVSARGITITDEVSALEQIGSRVKFIESRLPNLKITSPADLALAEAILT